MARMTRKKPGSRELMKVAPPVKDLSAAPQLDVALPMTPAEKEAGNKAYFDRVALLKEKETRTLEEMLMLYWEYGNFAADLFNSPRKYGDRVAVDLGRDLQLHPDTIRSYHKFYIMYTREQVKEAAAQGLRWRVLESLIKIRDPKERAKLQNRVIRKQLSSDELRVEAKKANQEGREEAVKKGVKVDRRGGLHDVDAFKNCLNACGEMTRKVDQYANACVNMKGITDPERLKKTEDYRLKARNALVQLKERIEKALES